MQHIQPQLGDVYEINIKDGQALSTDFALIAKKVGSDLEVLLEDNTTVIFDDYFNICTPDLSCLVSLPSTEGVYYVVDGSFTALADGSQIVHSYGDIKVLSTIAKGQSSAFESSFNELFLTEESSAFTYLPLLALGGGGGGSSSGSSSGGNDDTGKLVNPKKYPEDYISGGHLVDTIHGTAGDDYIRGGGANDVINGGAGDDILYGNEGDDTINGGAGKDRFMYDSISDGNDDIVDFQTGTGTDADVLDLSGLLTYISGDIITNFISFIDNGIDIIFNIDADGDASGTDVSIILLDMAVTDLDTMIADSNIVLL